MAHNEKIKTNTIGNRIKSLRTEKKLTQQDLADKLYHDGITKDNISKIERNKLKKIEKIIPIANYFNVSLDYLYGLSFYENLSEMAWSVLWQHIRRVLYSKEDNNVDYNFPIIEISKTLNNYIKSLCVDFKLRDYIVDGLDTSSIRNSAKEKLLDEIRVNIKDVSEIEYTDCVFIPIEELHKNPGLKKELENYYN